MDSGQVTCADLRLATIDAILGVTFMVGGGRERDILEGARDVTTAISLDIRYEGPKGCLENKAHICICYS